MTSWLKTVLEVYV